MSAIPSAINPTSLDSFFSQSGSYESYSIHSEGESPNRTYISEFHYSNGHSTFDGKKWNFVIYEPLNQPSL